MRWFTEWVEGDVRHVECENAGALAWYLYTRHDWTTTACLMVAEALWHGVRVSAAQYGLVMLPGRVALAELAVEARDDYDPGRVAA